MAVSKQNRSPGAATGTSNSTIGEYSLRSSPFPERSKTTIERAPVTTASAAGPSPFTSVQYAQKIDITDEK